VAGFNLMSNARRILIAKYGIVLAVIPVVIIANESGPDPRKTGAPGDGICSESGCHVGTAPSPNGKVEIAFPGGSTYTPGVAQTWTVTVSDPDQKAYGFQATARPQSNLSSGQAGSFRALPDSFTFVLCEDGCVKGSTRCRPNCAAQTPVEFIEHNMPRMSGTFQVEWTPPATDIGPVRVYVAGNAVNLNGQNTGDRIYQANYTLMPAAGFERPTIRAQQPVLQSFSGTAMVSSGTWLEIYGSNFSPATRTWGEADFNGNQGPTNLGGVRVNINGRPAYVSFISPNQVNVNAPDDPATGMVAVEVINPAGTSNSVIVNKAKVSTALLTTPLFNVQNRQYVAALHTDLTTFVGRPGLIAGVPFRAARPGDTIIVYAVGCGPTNPVSPAGEIVTAIRPLASSVDVTFGQTSATTAAFLSPPFVGLCRFDITVPNVADGDIQIEARVDGVATGQNLFTTVQR